MRARMIIGAAFGMTTLWSTQAAAQSKQCLEMDCFSERQVRDFEVIDKDTLVIYVGRERCAYKIKVDDLYCDLTFLPEIAFFDRRTRELSARLSGANPNDDFLLPRPGQSGTFNGRVCVHDAQLALETFDFAETVTEAPPGQAACEIREMSSITDDELLEVYVSEGLLPPPPPVGSGELSRAEDYDDIRDDNETERGSSADAAGADEPGESN